MHGITSLAQLHTQDMSPGFALNQRALPVYQNTIDFPACNTGIISVGGEMNNIHAYWSNYRPNIGWDALGTLAVTSVGNKQITSVGTSIATQISAASWVAVRQAKPSLNYQQIYSLIRNTASISNAVYVKNVPTLDLISALK